MIPMEKIPVYRQWFWKFEATYELRSLFPVAKKMRLIDFLYLEILKMISFLKLQQYPSRGPER